MWCISPHRTAHLLVQPLARRLDQSVAYATQQQCFIIVALLGELPSHIDKRRRHTHCKRTHIIATTLRCNEIAQCPSLALLVCTTLTWRSNLHLMHTTSTALAPLALHEDDTVARTIRLEETDSCR